MGKNARGYWDKLANLCKKSPPFCGDFERGNAVLFAFRAGGLGRQRDLREDDGDGTLPIGQRVRHAVFGEGTVLDVDLNKGAHVIQFDGMGTPRSISLRAKLEKIGP